MRAAARLIGATRYATYGLLDIDIMKHDPPWIVTGNLNSRVLVSSRIGCFTWGPYYVDLGALCLK